MVCTIRVNRRLKNEISHFEPITSSLCAFVPSWLAVNYAKQTQFQNGQYKHKYSTNKGLCQRTTNNEHQTLPKTNPIKPNSSPKLELCSTLSEVERPIKPNSPTPPQNPQNSLKNKASPPKIEFFTPRCSIYSCPT